jgi:hypothetical protein
MIIFFGLITFLACIPNVLTDHAKGDEQNQLEPGDFITMTMKDKYKPYFEGFGLYTVHSAMYIGEENGEEMCIDSMGIVRRVPPEHFEKIWENFEHYYVKDDNGPLNEYKKGQAIEYAKSKLYLPYQQIDQGKFAHYKTDDKIKLFGNYCQDNPPAWLTWLKLINHKISYYCVELVWGSYMALNPSINISYLSKHYNEYEKMDCGIGECYHGVTLYSFKREDNPYTQWFEPDNSPFITNYEDNPEGTVDGNLVEDDPTNNTWRTIQQGVDNLTTHDVLYIKNGNYNENIKVSKSMILIGETKDNVKINGTITIIDDLDYELPDYGKNSILVNVNMSKNEILFHFNNDSEFGENYSSSNIIFDYSGQENNGTNNGAMWNTTTIKGNGSFDFDGIDDSINLSSISALTGENVTVSSWIYLNEGTGSKAPIISQSNCTHGYCFFINSNAKPVFRLNDVNVTSSVNITSDEWHHIVGTHNQTTLKIYIDGLLQGNISKNGSGIDTFCFIGFDNNSNYFDGAIDEVAIWNRTLSDNEISDMYKANYGVLLENFTLQNGNTGLILGNRSEVYNFILSNFSKGIQIKGLTEAWIVGFNISDCDTAMAINNSNPGGYESISIELGNIENCSKGVIVNSSSYTNLFVIDFNCSDTNLKFNDCDINKIFVSNCTAPDNIAPETPSKVSGISLGVIDTDYSYDSITNDSDVDPIYYRIYWGDGNVSEWLGPYSSNETISFNHSWTEEGGYHILVQAKDVLFNESSWSEMFLFKTEEYPPLINNVSNTPYVIGFGGNITITTEVVDDDQNFSDVQSVYVNITYPNSCNVNYSMSNIGNNTYQYVFNDTWTVGQYNYTIWALDKAYNTNSSTGHSYNVSVQANISVCTIKDAYGDNETVNLTDPPSSSYMVGYRFLDNGKVLHIWNGYDNYYFNTSNGIQLTNHKDEYWSHNVLMLGYYNNDQWNLIYRTDELSGFNKNIKTDNETYVNATLWKDLAYAGYDIRLAIRYCLGVDDNELTVIPYIKNLDEEDIPYILGFGWEMKDIQVDMTPENDYIEINGTTYFLNQTLDETYKDMESSCYLIRENSSDSLSKSLYLRWDNNLNYKVKIKSREGQYNAPVSIFIRIGTLNAGQEKYTKMYWYDADQTTYFFDGYNVSEAWTFNPENMVDGNENNYASVITSGTVELCNNNTCNGTYLGSISKVELRLKGYRDGLPSDIILRPVYNGTTEKNNYTFNAPSGTSNWSEWFEIPSQSGKGWTWSEIKNLDCDVESDCIFGDRFTLYCSKVEIRVTYNNLPGSSNPYPADGSTGICLSPILNITISDPDGDNMTITWLSNSSGSWQEFGINSSASNGTYHQVFSNVTENGKWWFWKVNVSDNDGFNVSNVYKFYTGCQSKIENTGSTDIKGYLLMQVHYYNTTSENWTVADDTINETTIRTINSSEQLGLDTIFNGNVNTSSLLNSFGNGTYRVYAAFHDPDGDILVCDDESLLEATYEFSITSS